MTTLAEERAASVARTGEDLEERMRGTRARTLRTTFAEWMAKRKLNRARGRPPTLEDAARYLWPRYDDDRIARVVADANASHGDGQHVKQLTEEETRTLARAYVRENPQATSRTVFAHVRRVGQPHYQRASFATLVMSEIRKELGIKWSRQESLGEGRSLAEVDAEVDAAADSDRNDEGAVEIEDGVARHTLDELTDVTITTPAGFVDFDPFDLATPAGETIRIEVPGGKLNAVLLEGGDDRWSVDFVGVVTGAKVRELSDELVRQALSGFAAV